MPAWERYKGGILNQGDFLEGVSIPIVRASFPEGDASGNVPMSIGTANLIVMSQSCDLEQRKIPYVVASQVFTLTEFEESNSTYKRSGRWKEVSRGRVEALHLLPSPDPKPDDRKYMVVDFRLIVSLPLEYVERVAGEAGERWRLQSPFIENLSHDFGRFFSRVALPMDFPDVF
jgi:hypothetical protein